MNTIVTLQLTVVNILFVIYKPVFFLAANIKQNLDKTALCYLYICMYVYIFVCVFVHMICTYDYNFFKAGKRLNDYFQVIYD